MKTYIYLGICMLATFITGCAYKNINPEHSSELTHLRTLNQANGAWLVKNLPAYFVVGGKLKWPILSAELFNIFEAKKPLINLSRQDTHQSLFDKFETKENVNLNGLDEAMYPVLGKASIVWQKYGKKLVITSGLEGKHCKNSRHYLGLALDLRNRDLNKKDLFKILKELNIALGNDYQVLLESDHFHVEYDPVKRIAGM
jgi:hypothetical protein